MNAIQELFMIFGVIVAWYLIGVGVMKAITFRDRYWEDDIVVIFAFAIGWPVLGLITGLDRVRRQTLPWIKRKWKNLRAPKAAIKEEKKIEKIRMCPALKLKKYEELLNRVAKDHNEWYRGREIEIAVTQFERIKNGEPVREAQFQPALEVRPEGQAAVYFGRHNGFEFADAQAVAPAVEAVEEWVAQEQGPAEPAPERYYDGVDMYVR